MSSGELLHHVAFMSYPSSRVQNVGQCMSDAGTDSRLMHLASNPCVSYVRGRNSIQTLTKATSDEDHLRTARSRPVSCHDSCRMLRASRPPLHESAPHSSGSNGAFGAGNTIYHLPCPFQYPSLKSIASQLRLSSPDMWHSEEYLTSISQDTKNAALPHHLSKIRLFAAKWSP